MRQINDTGLEKIKQWEGLRLTAYQDGAGVWTIGYGHTGPLLDGARIKAGVTISREEADLLLRKDLEWAQVAVDSLVKVPLNDNQFAALVSFVFNVGETAFKNSTLLRKLNEGNYDAVPVELLRWNKLTQNGKKIVSKGLTNRRQAEIGLWAMESYVASNTVEPEPIQEKPAVAEPEVNGPAVASTGVAGTAVVETINESATQVSFLAQHSDTLKVLFIILTVVGIGLTIYGVWKRRRE